MKPLPIKEQIRILKKVLWLPFINDGMCVSIARVANTLGYNIYFREVTDIIPIFNCTAYLEFYSKVKAVQERNGYIFWDSYTIFGSLRRRWFIKHLIKELKKQL